MMTLAVAAAGIVQLRTVAEVDIYYLTGSRHHCFNHKLQITCGQGSHWNPPQAKEILI